MFNPGKLPPIGDAQDKGAVKAMGGAPARLRAPCRAAASRMRAARRPSRSCRPLSRLASAWDCGTEVAAQIPRPIIPGGDAACGRRTSRRSAASSLYIPRSGRSVRLFVAEQRVGTRTPAHYHTTGQRGKWAGDVAPGVDEIQRRATAHDDGRRICPPLRGPAKYGAACAHGRA